MYIEYEHIWLAEENYYLDSCAALYYILTSLTKLNWLKYNLIIIIYH